MDKADLEKFKRNSGQGQVVRVGEDDFFFKPLPLKHLPELMDFGRIINEQGETALMQKDNADRMFKILQVFVTNSYPDLGKEQDVLDGFIINNVGSIQNALMLTSIPKTGSALNDKQREAIERMKASAQPTSTNTE